MKMSSLHRFDGMPAGVVALCALAGVAVAAAGDLTGHAGKYARMAPIEQYLMDPAAEIALARSAAPSAISANATVLVLRRQGYESAASGNNGFTCLVERSWMSPFDSAEFWNPKIRGPICYNPAASRTILTYTVRRTQLALAGDSREKILAEIKAALARAELPTPETGAMSYMMASGGYLADDAGHWHSHLMFHLPKVAAASWGANLHGSPVIFDDRNMPEQSIFMVPVAHWSDGSDAPGM